MRTTFSCDKCRQSTSNPDPFSTSPTHWVRVDDKEFCSALCATAFWAEPIKQRIGAVYDWLERATEQLDYNPGAPAGDRMDVQMSSSAAGHLNEAMRILQECLRLAGKVQP